MWLLVRAPAWSLRRRFSSCSSVAGIVVVSPGVIVSVLSHGLKPGFSNFIAWSPTERCNVVGVFPTYFPSMLISAPSGFDLSSIVETIVSADAAAGVEEIALSVFAASGG